MRKILNEQGVYNDSLGIGDAMLFAGVQNGCFPGFEPSAIKLNNKPTITKTNQQTGNVAYISTENPDIPYYYGEIRDKNNNILKKTNSLTCEEVTNFFDIKPNLTGTRLEAYEKLKPYGYYITKDKPQGIEVTLVQVGGEPKAGLKTDADAMKILDPENTGTFKQLNTGAPLFLWKQIAAVQVPKTLAEKKTDFENMLLGSNYGYKKPNDVKIEEQSFYVQIDLGKIDTWPADLRNKYGGYAQAFRSPYILYRPKTETASDPQKESEQFKKENTIEECNNFILTYYRKYESMVKERREKGVFPPEVDHKDMVIACLTNWGMKKFPQFKTIVNNLTNTGDTYRSWDIGDESDFTGTKFFKPRKGLAKIFTKPKQITEDVQLKSLISESLIQLKKSKKKFISEQKIVRNRLEILVENRDLRKKRDLDRFFNDFLFETAYLNSRGYNHQVINEQFFDMLKGFFSGTGLDAIFQYFKEYAAKWLLEKFGISSTGWLGAIIITGLGNLPLGDINKLTDCNYLVPFLAKTIGEASVKKFMGDKGVDNALTSIVRNAVVEMLEDTSFAQALESGLEKLICPLLGDLSKKMTKVTGKLADKAEDSTNTTLQQA